MVFGKLVVTLAFSSHIFLFFFLGLVYMYKLLVYVGVFCSESKVLYIRSVIILLVWFIRKSYCFFGGFFVKKGDENKGETLYYVKNRCPLGRVRNG